MDLHNYDIIIINSSAGKDSLCSIYEICRMADEQKYDKSNIVVSHQDLKKMEWKGTKELAEKQADYFGLDFYVSTRRNNKGYEESLLEYVERRGKWPSSQQRWCTSDYKRGPGARVVTMLTKKLGQCKILYIFGFRKEESPVRSKKEKLSINKKLTTKKRLVYEYLPIHEWEEKKVWNTIKSNNLPYHYAYDLGMPRLSCVFCIFSPFDALVVAGYANPELLNEYISAEDKTGHTFRDKFSIREVKDAIKKGYKPKNIENWTM